MTSAFLSEVGRDGVRLGQTMRPVPLTPEEVAARIRKAREGKSPKPWSQFDLALALSVSPSTIYRWEKGKLPSMHELMRLADVLDVPLDHFTEPPEHQTELADLRSGLDALSLRLQSLEETHVRSREAVTEILASIHDQLVQIREQQERADAQAR